MIPTKFFQNRRWRNDSPMAFLLLCLVAAFTAWWFTVSEAPPVSRRGSVNQTVVGSNNVVHVGGSINLLDQNGSEITVPWDGEHAPSSIRQGTCDLWNGRCEVWLPRGASCMSPGNTIVMGDTDDKSILQVIAPTPKPYKGKMIWPATANWLCLIP